MVNRASIIAQIQQLKAELASTDIECEGCGAPLSPDDTVCSYCLRVVNPHPIDELLLPDEPPEIRKTNAADEPCSMCHQVHSKDPNAPPVCRCLYCGRVDRVAMSTTDARLGTGVVCFTCVRGGGPPTGTGFQQPMPWEST